MAIESILALHRSRFEAEQLNLGFWWPIEWNTQQYTFMSFLQECLFKFLVPREESRSTVTAQSLGIDWSLNLVPLSFSRPPNFKQPWERGYGACFSRRSRVNNNNNNNNNCFRNIIKIKLYQLFEVNMILVSAALKCSITNIFHQRALERLYLTLLGCLCFHISQFTLLFLYEISEVKD